MSLLTHFKNELLKNFSKIKSEKLLENITALKSTRADLGRNAAPQLALEALLIKLI